MKEDIKESSSLLERMLTCIFSAFAMFFTCLFFSYLIVRWTPIVRGWDFLGYDDNLFEAWASAEWLWFFTYALALLAGIVGFIVGGSKMLDIFGGLWNTNDPDGSDNGFYRFLIPALIVIIVIGSMAAIGQLVFDK